MLRRDPACTEIVERDVAHLVRRSAVVAAWRLTVVSGDDYLVAGLAPTRQVDGKRRIQKIELFVEMDRILAVGVADAVRRAGVNEDVVARMALRHDRHL